MDVAVEEILVKNLSRMLEWMTQKKVVRCISNNLNLKMENNPANLDRKVLNEFQCLFNTAVSRFHAKKTVRATGELQLLPDCRAHSNHL